MTIIIPTNAIQPVNAQHNYPSTGSTHPDTGRTSSEERNHLDIDKNCAAKLYDCLSDFAYLCRSTDWDKVRDYLMWLREDELATSCYSPGEAADYLEGLFDWVDTPYFGEFANVFDQLQSEQAQRDSDDGDYWEDNYDEDDYERGNIKVGAEWVL